MANSRLKTSDLVAPRFSRALQLSISSFVFSRPTRKETAQRTICKVLEGQIRNDLHIASLHSPLTSAVEIVRMKQAEKETDFTTISPGERSQ